MNQREEEFLQSLRAAFQTEAREHLQAMSDGLLNLEKIPAAAGQAPLVETVYREAHSLKGAARAVNLTDIEQLCQALESLFAAWKRQELQPTPALFDTAHHALDVITSLIAGPVEAARVTGAIEQLDSLRAGNAPAPPAREPVPAAAPAPDTVRVAAAKLESLLLQAEELLNARLTAGQRAAELRELGATFDEWRKEWNRVAAQSRALRKEQPAVADFLDWNATCLLSLDPRLGA